MAYWPNVRPCPRCGKPWTPWKGSRLETHGRCHFTDEAADDIYDLYAQFPLLRLDRLARDLSVTMAVVRATFRKVEKRRRLMTRAC